MNRQRKTVGRFPVSIRRMQACDESAFIKTVLPIIIVNANALAGGRMAVATRPVHAPMVAPQPQYRQLPNTRLHAAFLYQSISAPRRAVSPTASTHDRELD